MVIAAAATALIQPNLEQARRPDRPELARKHCAGGNRKQLFVIYNLFHYSCL